MPATGLARQHAELLAFTDDPRVPGQGTPDYSGAGSYSYGRSSSYAGTDPERAYADMARGQHERYIRDYRAFEEELLGSRRDQSLVTQAKEDAETQSEIAAGIQQRNLSRYGRQLTAVERQESERAQTRGQSLSLAGGINNARLAQREANQRLLGELINIGQDVNRSAMQQMGVSAENSVARRNAYRQARASHKSQTMGMIGQLGAMAIMAAMI